MKKKILMLIIVSVCLTSIIAIFTFTTQAAVTSNKLGTHDGYDYEFWKDSGGSASMELKSAGAFSCKWNGINNVLCRKGKRLGSTKTHDQYGNIEVDYKASYNPQGTSYMCVYGWTQNPLIEYYIVESWENWKPGNDGQNLGTITVDGGVYDIYTKTRTNKPSIEGTKTFKQIFSVRRAERTSGKISVSKHFEKWESLGFKLGKLYEVSFTIEGYKSNGTADVQKNILTIGGSSNENTPENTVKNTPKATSTSTPKTTVENPPNNNNSNNKISTKVTILNSWSNGGQAKVIIKNESSSPTNGWTTKVDLPGKANQVWGAKSSGSNPVTLTNEDWNGVIQPNGSVEVGVIYSK